MYDRCDLQSSVWHRTSPGPIVVGALGVEELFGSLFLSLVVFLSSCPCSLLSNLGVLFVFSVLLSVFSFLLSILCSMLCYICASPLRESS